MKILLLDDNLLSSTKVAGALRSQHHEVQTVTRVAAVPPSGDFERIVMNVGSRLLNALDAVEMLRERFPNAQLSGFCGHREVELWKRARTLGVQMTTNEAAMNGEI